MNAERGGEAVRVENITKTFRLSRKQRSLERGFPAGGVKTAVDGLSFSVRRGEVFALLGPNGAGKTTTLRILASLMHSDSGDAFVEGFSVRQKPREARRRLGFLTSDLRLEEFFTPAYLFDFFAALHETPPALARERRERLFARFGVTPFAREKVSALSSGMKQKAALAVSVAHDPPVIIFDEPTNGLDVIAAKAVTDFLLELKARGKTIILSTHIFSLVEKLADRAGILIDGKLAACDTLERLCGRESLENRFFALFAQRAAPGGCEENGVGGEG